MREQSYYKRPDFDLTDFTAGARVLDVGCGQGRHLRALTTRGHWVVGLDFDAEALGDAALAAPVVRGSAERLPFATESVDGVVCSVVLSQVDERDTLGEIGRVLRPGGTLRASYIGIGYYLRLLVVGPYRRYGLGVLCHTIWYRLTARRLPRRVCDSVAQSRAGLRQRYQASGLSPHYS